jgi:hypothetical protein
MALEIVQAGDPVLRQRGRLLTAEEIRSREIQQLIEEMREAMRSAPGVGLAAPQAGYPLQLAVIEDRSDYHQKLTASQLEERERRPAGLTKAERSSKVVSAWKGFARWFRDHCLCGWSILTSMARRDRRTQPDGTLASCNTKSTICTRSISIACSAGVSRASRTWGSTGKIWPLRKFFTG